MPPPDLNDLYYFVQVVDHRGFAAAGRALAMPKSRLSRRIAALEARLGVRLIQRTTRTFATTELGQAYYQHCKAMLVEADAAQGVIDSTHAGPCGVIRLSCPVALLHAHVGQMLVDFAVRYPDVTLQVMGINRPVDVVAEGFDLALRVRPLPMDDSALAMRVLGHAAQYLVASPSLVDRYGLPRAPVELASWPSLGYGPPADDHRWILFGPDGAQAEQRHQPRFVTADMATLRQAAAAGVGVVQLPAMIVRDQIASGALVRLLPDWSPRREVIHAAFPTRRGLVSSVRALIDDLADRFASLDQS